MKIPSNHSSLIYEKLVNNICRELFNKTPINYFNFARFYKDGYVLNLTSNNLWHTHYWEKCYINNSNLRLKEGVNYWLAHEKISKSAEDAEKNFDICGRIEFINDHENHIDSFGFACSSINKDKIIDYYLNNLRFLESFNLFFLSEVDGVIKKIEKKSDFLKLPFSPSIIKRNYETVEMNYAKSKVFFSFSSVEIEITLFQFKVLAFKLRGYSNEKISYYLECTVDNIKTHLKNIRKRIVPPDNEEFIEFCIRIGIYNLSQPLYINIKNRLRT